MEYSELLLNIAKQFTKLSSIFMKVVEIQTILNNFRQILTVFPSDFNNIYLKYFGILQNLTRNYEILRKFMKPTIFHSIFSVNSLTFIPFRPITKYYWHFMISYCDEQNSSICYCTILPLGDISKYFAIVKRKVIFSISQILTSQAKCCFSQPMLTFLFRTNSTRPIDFRTNDVAITQEDERSFHCLASIDSS